MPHILPRKSTYHLFLIIVLCGLPYTGSLFNSWHLDDFPNILNNSALHIASLQPSAISQSFKAHPTVPGKIFRPVANFSFGLNWYFNRDRVLGYHLINISIHLLTAIALYFASLLLLQSPNIKNYSLPESHSIALLTALLWAIAPSQTQAVTYIVQRMAQLATFFTIGSICFFLLARLTQEISRRIIFWFCCLFCAMLAMGSKENAIILPFSLVLIEYVFFFQGKSLLTILARHKTLCIIALAALCISVLAINQIYGNNLLDYGSRNFTMSERLLTEPRILIFYLTQIFFPTPATLSIEHDIVLSTSLFSPWYTLAAIALCLGLISFAFIRIKKNPLISFAILFFFLNHLVESTVLPLELLFEHRNYLPSLFLFLPIAAFVVSILRTTETSKNRPRSFLLLAACCLFILLSGISTARRNTAWATEQSLWKDAVLKAPKSGRAKINLAKALVEHGSYQEAFLLYNQAEKLAGSSRNKIAAISLNGKGSIAYLQGHPHGALHYFKKALLLRPDYTDLRYKTVALLVELGRDQDALEMASRDQTNRRTDESLLLQAPILLRLNRAESSLNTYQKARRMFPNGPSTAAGSAKALSMLGLYQQADILLRYAILRQEPGAIFLRIENFILWGKEPYATALLRQLLSTTPLESLLNSLKTAPANVLSPPFDQQMIRNKLLEALRTKKSSSYN